MDFLFHEMLMIALVHDIRRTAADLLDPLNRLPGLIIIFNAALGNHAPVMVFQIGNFIGKGCQSNGI